MTAEQRFWAKVDGGDVDNCWIWTGADNGAGYGYFWSGERLILAHRWAYEELVTEIPPGLQLDHRCQVRACVNPWHLDPVTGAVNNRRGNSLSAIAGRRRSCQHGHAYDEANTYVVPASGERKCRTCHRERMRRSRLAQKLAAASTAA